MMARAGLTADKVVAAAADLADEAGFDHLTVSGLARRLDVRDASLYSHVRNLADLRARVALLAIGEFADRIGAAVAGRAGKDALAAFAAAYRSFAVDHPGRYAATRTPLDAETLASTDAAHRTIELTRALLRGYDLDEVGETDAVRLLRGFFHGFADLELNGAFLHGRDVSASWDRAVDALHFTLTHWGEHS